MTITPKTMTPQARAAAVLGVLKSELARLAGSVTDPKLAGALGHFAGAAAWAEQTLRVSERTAEHGGRLEDLSAQASGLLGDIRHVSPTRDTGQLIELLDEATRHNVAGARELLDEFLRTARTIEEGPAEAAGPQDAPPTPARLTVEQMSSYLRKRFGADAEAHDLQYVAGGFSKHTILVSATFGGIRQDIVFRQVPKGRHEEDLPFEFDVLRHVWAPARPVPEPLWIESAHNDLGGPFLVTRKMPGSPLGDVFGAKVRVPEQFCLDLADFLAELHSIDPSPIAVTPVRPMRTPHEIRQAIDEMAARADDAAGITPRLAAVFGWLRAHIPERDDRPSLIHGDLGLHNALAANDRLTALLDWERSHLGDPAEDLAYLRPFLAPVYPWQAFIDRYVESGGKAPDPAVERFYTVWQDTWRHVQCLTHGANFFNNRSVPAMIAGFVFAPRFLAAAVEGAFGSTTHSDGEAA
jgi:aminoglycoside phosphotransferase (APT) family kinase protein